jgi:hypothetical protein
MEVKVCLNTPKWYGNRQQPGLMKRYPTDRYVDIQRQLTDIAIGYFSLSSS